MLIELLRVLTFDQKVKLSKLSGKYFLIYIFRFENLTDGRTSLCQLGQSMIKHNRHHNDNKCSKPFFRDKPSQIRQVAKAKNRLFVSRFIVFSLLLHIEVKLCYFPQNMNESFKTTILFSQLRAKQPFSISKQNLQVSLKENTEPSNSFKVTHIQLLR